MRPFNYRLFWVMFVALAIITFFAFSTIFDAGVEDHGGSIVKVFSSGFISVMRFPFHYILPAFMRNPLFFALGLILDCFLYCVVLERLLSLFLKNSRGAAD